ncbi:MAG: ABC transporter permease, partial [Gammaproteobacteria bacterium]|nr:ABC transporter permease [Gammaproteobacteria bacterium]
MRAVLTVFLKEFRENLRERRTLLSALILGPLLGPLLFAGGLTLRLERGIGESDRPIELAVAHGERAPNLLAYLRAHGVTITAVEYDDSAARTAVRAGRLGLLLSVDADFGARLAAGLPAPLELYADTSDLAGSGDSA